MRHMFGLYASKGRQHVTCQARVVPRTIEIGNRLLLALDVAFTVRYGSLADRQMVQFHLSVHRIYPSLRNQPLTVPPG